MTPWLKLINSEVNLPEPLNPHEINIRAIVAGLPFFTSYPGKQTFSSADL
jgi:hypothetical protein